MELGRLKPPFRQVACCLAYLALLVGLAATLAFAALHFPPISDVFNPHGTGGALMLMGLFVLAVLDFFALLYFVSRTVVELYRQPNDRTGSHLAVVVAGVIALVVLGGFLNWFYHR